MAIELYIVQYFPGGHEVGDPERQSYPGSHGKQSSRESDPRLELKVPDGQFTEGFVTAMVASVQY